MDSLSSACSPKPSTTPSTLEQKPVLPMSTNTTPPTSSPPRMSSWRIISKRECIAYAVTLLTFLAAGSLIVAGDDIVCFGRRVFLGETDGKYSTSISSIQATTTLGRANDASTSPTQTNSSSSSSSSSFSVVFAVLPDTQYYSEGAPYIFNAQTRWLAENAHQMGNPFVLHLGDLIQSPWDDDNGGAAQAQWQLASEAMSLLEAANISYSVMPGNHDLKSAGWDQNRTHDEEGYLRYFGPERAAQQHTFRGRDPLGYSECHYISFTSSSSSNNDGRSFLVLALDWRASIGTLEWAQSVLDEFPSVPTILTSHEFLTLPWEYDYNNTNSNNSSDDYYVYRTDYGDMLWNDLIADRNEIFLVLCGHINGTGYRIDDNSYGQPVVSVLIDYQSRHAGGNGYMRLIEFDLLQNTMEHLTFSPFVVDLYHSQNDTATTSNQEQRDFDTTLGPHDYAELTDPANKYVVPFKFQERFRQMQHPTSDAPPSSAMMLPLSSSSSSSTSLLDPVRAMLAKVPMPPNMDDKPRPSDSSDYFNATNTLAHWRFDREHILGFNHGGTIPQAQQQEQGDDPVHGVIKDMSGHGNDLIRQDTADLQNDTTTNYLTWSDDHHPLSASTGSICFSNPTRNSGSFLVTIPGSSAPLETETFRSLSNNGYTIEAFVRLAPSWDDSQHRWSGVVSRIGEGQDSGRPITGGDPKEPLVVLGFSSTAETQFAVFPDTLEQDTPGMQGSSSSYLRASHDVATNDTTRVITTWTSPLNLNQWYHIAAVNTNGTTRLFIDGYPARRDPNPLHDDGHANGIALPANLVANNDDKNVAGWSIGSATYDSRYKVFGGCIGEVRIVGRPLAPDEFLMSRRRSDYNGPARP